MKKVLKLIFLAAMLMTFALAFASCGRDDDDDVDEGLRIALIAWGPASILHDGSFNEGAWTGINQFIASQGLDPDSVQFFQPHVDSDDARIDMIESAVNAGFNALILPGFHFVSALYSAQDIFPDVYFVLLDATPAGPGGPRIQPNTVAIHYAEEEAGFLAGYAAVMDGFRELGFTGGMPVPAVVRFGHGFIQGAEHAAEVLGLSQGEVTINYHYFGLFAPDPAFQTIAASWFATGTEVIFAAAGGAGASVKAAAEDAGAWVIGVDVDQSGISPTVISSAMKALDVSVYDMLTDILYGRFDGGQALMFNAAINGVGLPMGTSQWRTFTMAQYNAIYAQLADGTITVNNSLDFDEIIGTISLVTVVDLR